MVLLVYPPDCQGSFTTGASVFGLMVAVCVPILVTRIVYGGESSLKTSGRYAGAVACHTVADGSARLHDVFPGGTQMSGYALRRLERF